METGNNRRQRKRMLKWGALNIKTNPHSPELYVELISAAARAGNEARYYGNRTAEIGDLADHAVEGVRVLTGNLHLYLDIDVDSPWYNKKAREEIDPEDVGDISQLEMMKPEHSSVPFVFFPAEHKLIFLNVIGPRSAQRILEGILSPLAKERQRHLAVTIVQDHDALDRIYEMARLETLTIEITPPNPDDGADFERRLMARLQGQNAGTFRQTIKASTRDGLAPDEETRKLADTALLDGWVYGKGRDENGMVVETLTADSPLLFRCEFDPNNMSFLDGMIDAGRKLLDHLRSKKER